MYFYECDICGFTCSDESYYYLDKSIVRCLKCKYFLETRTDIREKDHKFSNLSLIYDCRKYARINVTGTDHR